MASRFKKGDRVKPTGWWWRDCPVLTVATPVLGYGEGFFDTHGSYWMDNDIELVGSTTPKSPTIPGHLILSTARHMPTWVSA